MIWFLKLTVLTLLIRLNLTAKLIPETVYTQIGASYTVMLVHDNVKLKECYLSDGRTLYEIDLNAEVPLKSIKNVRTVEENTNILTSLGRGICGFKLVNLGNTYASNWNISSVDENGEIYYADAKVKPIDVQTRNITEYVTIGDKFEILCGDVSNMQLLLNCELYDPQGLLVSSFTSENYMSPCSYSVKMSKMSDYGPWKCVMRLENDMYERKVFYNIVERENPIIHTWQNETNTHMNIGCLFKNYTQFTDNKKFCEMVRPDGKILVLKEGMATERYTALNTLISNKVCGLEIRKPLKEFEKGLWRCQLYTKTEFNDKIDIIGGSFINLSKNSSSLPPPDIPKKIVSLLGSSLSVTCKVPYSSSYCYMRPPHNAIYIVENQGPTAGICKYTIPRFNYNDNGSWSCGFGKSTGEPDALYPFEVSVLESYSIEPEKRIIKSEAGSTVNLTCSTKGYGDFPLQYCRFKSPKGVIYTINPEESSDRISYYGRGLKYGDCGIELKNIQLNESGGTWTCYSRIGYNFNKNFVEFSREFSLIISN